MSRPKKTREIQFKHAQKRARERYGLFLTFEDYMSFVNLIREGTSSKRVLPLGRESISRSHFLIDDMYIVVYDKTRQSIATFLPADAINNYLPLINGRPSFMGREHTKSYED